MIEERLPLAELLAKAGKGDFLCSGEPVVQLLIETDVEGLIGASQAGRLRSVFAAGPGDILDAIGPWTPPRRAAMIEAKRILP